MTPVFFDENWVDVWPEETDKPYTNLYTGHRVQYKFGTILLHVVIDEHDKIAVWKVEDVDVK